MREERTREGGEGGQRCGTRAEKAGPSLYPDVGVLMDFSQVQHVVQGQHSRRSLRKVHCWVDMVLQEEET